MSMFSPAFSLSFPPLRAFLCRTSFPRLLCLLPLESQVPVFVPGCQEEGLWRGQGLVLSLSLSVFISPPLPSLSFCSLSQSAQRTVNETDGRVVGFFRSASYASVRGWVCPYRIYPGLIEPLSRRYISINSSSTLSESHPDYRHHHHHGFLRHFKDDLL